MNSETTSSEGLAQAEYGFERLLADLSAQFVNVDDGEVDSRIQGAMAEVCDHLGLEVCALWQMEEGNPETFVLSHYHVPPENFPPVPERMEGAVSFPWSLSRALAGETIVLSDCADFPVGAEVDAQGWQHYGLTNMLCFPLMTGRRAPFGIVSFHDRGVPRQWTPDLVNRLGLVAGIFANALVRKYSWRALTESEDRLSHALEASTAGAWVLDRSKSTFWLGHHMDVLLGIHPAEEITVTAFIDMVHPEDTARVVQAMDTAFFSPEPTIVDYRLHRQDGELRWFQSRGRAIQENIHGSVRLMGITLDITERKKAELEAGELRRELAHVTRTSMMGELAASICHELNQPLAAILSNAQAARRFLAETSPEPDEIRAIVEDIIRDDKRAAEVIQRLRSLFMKNNAVPAQILSVYDVVDEVVELLQPELSARGVTLTVLNRENGPQVRVVRVDLQQILLNLIVNAMDAMEETPRHLHISTEILKDGVRLSLADSGKGIDREILPEIFRPYFSTKSKGMGMGLAVAQSMMEQHQGRIRAENHPGGRGAVFHLDFPAVGKDLRGDTI